MFWFLFVLKKCSMMCEEKYIVVTTLNKKFNEYFSIKNLSFDVCKGEVFGLLGGDGSGKTTILKLLSGILKPAFGFIAIDGVNIKSFKRSIKMKTGYMGDNVKLYEDLTVIENINLYAGLYGMKKHKIRQRSRELLTQLDLKHVSNCFVSDISKGFKRMLGFIISIIHEPEIVFLDEPTKGLDEKRTKNIWKLIFGLKKTGITVVLALNNSIEAELCDKVAVLKEGEVVVLNSPHNLIKNYESQNMNEVYSYVAI